MKIYFALLLLVICSCSKTKINSPIVGRWALDSIRVGVNGRNMWESSVTFAPVTLTFSSDGSFSQRNSNIIGYNHFQLLSNDTIRFYNPTYQKGLKIKYALGDKLTIYYNCIEGCAEKYRRTL